MVDIVDMLNATANRELSTYDVADDSVRVGCETLRSAAAEIVRLRATIEQLRFVAGDVSMESPAFSAIKKEINDVK